MDEQHRHLRHAHRFERRRLRHRHSRFELAHHINKLHDRELRQPEQFFQLSPEHLICRRIATVLDHRLHVRRQIFRRRHHHRRRAHRHAMQYDLRLRIVFQNHCDPTDQIIALFRAHCDIIAFGFSRRSKVGRHHIPTVLEICLGVIVGEGAIATVAVDQQCPSMTFLRRLESIGCQFEPVARGDRPKLAIGIGSGRRFQIGIGNRRTRRRRRTVFAALQCKLHKIIPDQISRRHDHRQQQK